MSSGTRDERAAYEYYVENCVQKGHTPQSFKWWQSRVTKSFVTTMVTLGLTKPWEPICKFGYPMTQVSQLMGAELFERFSEWMRGQGGAICGNGDGDGSHGLVVWESDLDRFMAWPPRRARGASDKITSSGGGRRATRSDSKDGQAERRDVPMLIRMRGSEHKEVRAAAAKSGMGISTFVRAAALEKARVS